MDVESYYRYHTATQLSKMAYGGKMLGKQDILIDKQDQMLGKQDKVLSKQDEASRLLVRSLRERVRIT